MPYSSDDIVSGTPKEGDYDLQEFLLMEKQKAQLNAQVWNIVGSYSNYVCGRNGTLVWMPAISWCYQQDSVLFWGVGHAKVFRPKETIFNLTEVSHIFAHL